MNGTNAIKQAALGVAALAVAGVLEIGSAAAEEDWRELYLGAKPVLDVRYRFEFVDQDGVPEDAKANTVRTRAGVESSS